MSRKRRERAFARKMHVLADASEGADVDVTALLDELDEAAARAVAAEMTARPVPRALSESEIQEKEFNEVLRELERAEREQRRAECARLNAISREEARLAEAVAAQRRHAEELAQASRERMAQHARERQAQADREELARLKQWATAREAADQQHQREATAAANRQRVEAAHKNLMQAFDSILRPAELPPEPQPAEPYQGSPHFGSPDFSPDAAIARFAPWKPWQP